MIVEFSSYTVQYNYFEGVEDRNEDECAFFS